jgi:hypothetical protein
MNPTIPLNGPLAGVVPPAVAAGADEVARLASDEEWARANARRVALIEKRHLGGGLTGEEEAELALLDAAADQRAAPQDQKLIGKAEEILRRARGLRDASAP